MRIRLESIFPASANWFLWPLPQECQCRARENLRHRHLSSSSFYFWHSGWNFCENHRYTGALPDRQKNQSQSWPIPWRQQQVSVKLWGFRPLQGIGKTDGRQDVGLPEAHYWGAEEHQENANITLCGVSYTKPPVNGENSKWYRFSKGRDSCNRDAQGEGPWLKGRTLGIQEAFQMGRSAKTLEFPMEDDRKSEWGGPGYSVSWVMMAAHVM